MLALLGTKRRAKFTVGVRTLAADVIVVGVDNAARGRGRGALLVLDAEGLVHPAPQRLLLPPLGDIDDELDRAYVQWEQREQEKRAAARPAAPEAMNLLLEQEGFPALMQEEREEEEEEEDLLAGHELDVESFLQAQRVLREEHAQAAARRAAARAAAAAGAAVAPLAVEAAPEGAAAEGAAAAVEPMPMVLAEEEEEKEDEAMQAPHNGPPPLAPHCFLCLDDATRTVELGACGAAACSPCMQRYLRTTLASSESAEIACPCARMPHALPWTTVAEMVGDDEQLLVGLMKRFAPSGNEEAAAPAAAPVDDVAGCLKRASELNRVALEDALTLKKPCCGGALMDFDGCFAILCDACHQHFCAWCLTAVAASSGDIHAHVMACPENPEPGNCYGNYDHWRATHVPKKQRLVIDAHSQAATAAFSEALRDSLARCSDAQDGL